MFFVYDNIEGFHLFSDEQEDDAKRLFNKIKSEVEEVKEHWEVGELNLCMGRVSESLELIIKKDESGEEKASYQIKKH